jgi:nicotinamidase-related amidase
MPHANILDAKNTALVIVDVQEAFRTAIPDFALITSRISTAVRGFRILDVPVCLTEQYPKGLGRTAEEILLVLPDDFEPVEKTAFSSCGAAAFEQSLKGVKNVVLCGVETHVCVNQTAHDLIEKGFAVHVLEDCVASRFEHDRQAGLAKMRLAGTVPSTIEMALFELMRDARHEQFKEIQALIK